MSNQSVISISTAPVPTNKTYLDIPPQYSEPSASIWFRFVFFGIITLASLLGNGIVVKSIMNIPYSKPFTYHMVTNLAIAELISSLAIPFMQAYEQMNTWKLGETMCKITNPVQITSSLVVTWSLAVISLHRYRTLVFQNHRPLFLKNASFIMLCMWASAVAIALPLYMYSTLVISPYERDRVWCIVLFPGDTLQTFPSTVYKRYIMVRFSINFLVPVLIMVFAYGAMGVKLKYHMATIKNSDTELSVTNPMRFSVEEYAASNLNNLDNGQSINSDCSNAFENLAPIENERQEPPSLSERKVTGYCATREYGNSAAVIQSAAEQKAGGSVARNTSQGTANQTRSTNQNLLIEFEQDLLKMIYVIVFIFIFSYFPYQVFFLLEYFGILVYGNWYYFHITRRYVYIITCLPSALHPLCYGTMSKFYAKAFRNIVLCKRIGNYPQNAA